MRASTFASGESPRVVHWNSIVEIWRAGISFAVCTIATNGTFPRCAQNSLALAAPTLAASDCVLSMAVSRQAFSPMLTMSPLVEQARRNIVNALIAYDFMLASVKNVARMNITG